MKVLGWIAVYTTPDGLRLYTSREHEWADLPGDGWLDGCVYSESDGTLYRRTLGGTDYYWLLPDTGGGPGTVAHSNDPPEEIRERYPGADIKRGKWATDAVMAEAAQMVLDYEWPRP